MLKNTQEEVVWASVLADGKLHVTVPEGTEGSVIREYEKSDGTKGSKNELVYTEISGLITEIKFYDGDYGKQLLLTFVDGEEKPVTLALSTASNFGEDVLKKIINVDLALPVKFAPYAFTDDVSKKLKKGITITQNGKKIENYFYDKEKKENINGYPVAPQPAKKKGITVPVNKEEWKIWFMQCRIFLIDKITEHFKLDEVVADTTQIEYPISDASNDGSGFELLGTK